MDFQKITFIVQGAYSLKTEALLNQLSLSFPDSLVILSTWPSDLLPLTFANQKISLIINQDPGPFCIVSKQGNHIRSENINRQILSTQSALDKCTTEYAFKLRSDFQLNCRYMIKMLATYSTQIQKGKILLSTFNTISPLSYPGYCFHFSDWFVLGKTQQLINMIRNQPVPSIHPYNTHSNPLSRDFPVAFLSCEQFFFEPLRNSYSTSKFNYFYRIYATYKFLLLNTIVLHPSTCGLSLEHYHSLTDRRNIKSYLFSLSTVPEIKNSHLFSHLNVLLIVIIKSPLSYLYALTRYFRSY